MQHAKVKKKIQYEMVERYIYTYRRAKLLNQDYVREENVEALKQRQYNEKERAVCVYMKYT